MQASQSHPGQGDRGKIVAWRLVDGVRYSGVPTRIGTFPAHLRVDPAGQAGVAAMGV